MADCCLIKKVATVEVYENKNEVRAYGFMAGDRNTPVMEVRFKHLWGESNLSSCKLRWIIVDDVGSLLVGEVPIQSDNTALINLPNELFTGDRRMKVQLTVASCDGERILNLQQFTDLKVINNLATNEVVEPVYDILINKLYDGDLTFVLDNFETLKAEYQKNNALLGEALNGMITNSRLTNNSITSDKLRIAEDSSKIKLINLSDEVIRALSGNSPVRPEIGSGEVVSEKIASGAVSRAKLSDNYDSNGAMPNGTDLNTCIKSGSYRVFNPTNSHPEISKNYIMLTVYNIEGASRGYQLATSTAAGSTLYIRTWNNNIFSNWERVSQEKTTTATSGIDVTTLPNGTYWCGVNFSDKLPSTSAGVLTIKKGNAYNHVYLEFWFANSIYYSQTTVGGIPVWNPVSTLTEEQVVISKSRVIKDQDLATLEISGNYVYRVLTSGTCYNLPPLSDDFNLEFINLGSAYFGRKIYKVIYLKTLQEFFGFYMGSGEVNWYQKAKFSRTYKKRTCVRCGDSIMAWSIGEIYNDILIPKYSEVINSARAGSSYALRNNADNDQWALCNRVKLGAANPIDLENTNTLVIWMGTNDFGNKIPMGDETPTNFNENTVYGAMNSTYKSIMDRNKNIHILVITPLWRNQAQDLYEFGKKIEKFWKSKNIKTVNAWEEFGVNQENHTVKLSDGLHASESFNETLTEIVAEFIKCNS